MLFMIKFLTSGKTNPENYSNFFPNKFVHYFNIRYIFERTKILPHRAYSSH